MSQFTAKSDSLYAHHRLHEEVLNYWESLRGNRPFPTESDIDPDEVADIWPSCFLISLDDVTRRLGYRYSYLGEALIEAYGDDIKNPEIVMRLISTNSLPLAKRFDEVVKSKAPLFDEAEFVNLKQMRIKYRTCLLPLGNSDGQVTHILGSMRWKAY